MSYHQRKIGFWPLLLVIAVTTFAMYFIAFTIIGPLIIDKLGAFPAKVATIFVTFVCIAIFVYILRKDRISYIAPYSSVKPKRKKSLLFFAIIAFVMAPFGFAGVLESRGSGYLPPLWGGGLCIASGLILMWLYFKKS